MIIPVYVRGHVDMIVCVHKFAPNARDLGAQYDAIKPMAGHSSTDSRAVRVGDQRQMDAVATADGCITFADKRRGRFSRGAGRGTGAPNTPPAERRRLTFDCWRYSREMKTNQPTTRYNRKTSIN